MVIATSSWDVGPNGNGGNAVVRRIELGKGEMGTE